MRVLSECLSPGMQDGQEAELCAETLGIGSDIEQRGGTGLEEQGKQLPFVLPHQRHKRMWNAEDQVVVVDGQQLLLPLARPLIARTGLALGAMSITAGVVRDGLMAASGTAIQVTTELCCAASLDGIKYPQMEPGQPGSVLSDEAVAVLSDDVGHLERCPIHRFCNFRERLLLSGLETGIASSGLATAVRCFWERCR